MEAVIGIPTDRDPKLAIMAVFQGWDGKTGQKLLIRIGCILAKWDIASNWRSSEALRSRNGYKGWTTALWPKRWYIGPEVACTNITKSGGSGESTMKYPDPAINRVTLREKMHNSKPAVWWRRSEANTSTTNYVLSLRSLCLEGYSARGRWDKCRR